MHSMATHHPIEQHFLVPGTADRSVSVRLPLQGKPRVRCHHFVCLHDNWGDDVQNLLGSAQVQAEQESEGQAFDCGAR